MVEGCKEKKREMRRKLKRWRKGKGEEQKKLGVKKD